MLLICIRNWTQWSGALWLSPCLRKRKKKKNNWCGFVSDRDEGDNPGSYQWKVPQPASLIVGMHQCSCFFILCRWCRSIHSNLENANYTIKASLWLFQEVYAKPHFSQPAAAKHHRLRVHGNKRPVTEEKAAFVKLQLFVL